MRSPGPLAISAVAIFGNESFFGASRTAARSNESAAAVNLCQNVRMPFLSVDKDDFLNLISRRTGVLGSYTRQRMRQRTMITAIA